MNDGDFSEYLRRYVRRHPTRGYGGMFIEWAMTDMGPYGSWGNGSAMRVSPVAHVARDETELLALAEASSAVTHSHPEAIAGAQAVALTMWRVKSGMPILEVREEISDRFGYDLSQTVDQIRSWYRFDVSSKGSVTQAIACALEASDFEDAVRNAISIGGDSDTIGCIAGGIAELMFGVPDAVAETALGYLTDDLEDAFSRFGASVG